MELQILAVFLLALSSNLDNVGVGTSYGTRTINIPFSSNLLIAFITTTGTYLSMAAGNKISNFINPNVSNAIGALMIGGTGAWVLIREFSRPDEDKSTAAEYLKTTSFASQSPLKKMLTILDHPFLADTDFSGHIDMKEG
ncbi:MAG: manganese efflux pump, partial [Desulfomonilaceae bacterium]